MARLCISHPSPRSELAQTAQYFSVSNLYLFHSMCVQVNAHTVDPEALVLSEATLFSPLSLLSHTMKSNINVLFPINVCAGLFSSCRI